MDEWALAIGDAVKAFIRDERASDFESLALEIFGYQYERNRPYREFCRMRGGLPGNVTAWTEIPPIPTDAFRSVELTCAQASLTFRTSGTMRGTERRGTHHVCDPTLYELALVEGFRRFVMPDRARIRVLSLVPSRAEAPDSSLSYMADTVRRVYGDEESATVVGHRRVLVGHLMASLRRARATGTPVLLLGTTLAFISVLEVAEGARETFVLPAGSRLMDTGGPKGRGQEIAEETLLSRYRAVFGLSARACVNEYGMTELLSQLYNDDLARAARGDREPDRAGRIDRAVKRAPHWVRCRVLEPETLADADRGLLCHVDLANCHSVIGVLTEDVGSRAGDGFRFEGRVPSAASRGCSIAMDEWLR
jgi:hypothetical protein